MWWVGSIPIVLSYLHLVPIWLAWCGFVLAGASTLIGVIQARYWKPPASDSGSGSGESKQL
jgi:hypothetical protein